MINSGVCVKEATGGWLPPARALLPSIVKSRPVVAIMIIMNKITERTLIYPSPQALFHTHSLNLSLLDDTSISGFFDSIDLFFSQI
jgi:hypothetical protein